MSATVDSHLPPNGPMSELPPRGHGKVAGPSEGSESSQADGEDGVIVNGKSIDNLPMGDVPSHKAEEPIRLPDMDYANGVRLPDIVIREPSLISSNGDFGGVPLQSTDSAGLSLLAPQARIAGLHPIVEVGSLESLADRIATTGGSDQKLTLSPVRDSGESLSSSSSGGTRKKADGGEGRVRRASMEGIGDRIVDGSHTWEPPSDWRIPSGELGLPNHRQRAWLPTGSASVIAGESGFANHHSIIATTNSSGGVTPDSGHSSDEEADHDADENGPNRCSTYIYHPAFDQKKHSFIQKLLHPKAVSAHEDIIVSRSSTPSPAPHIIHETKDKPLPPPTSSAPADRPVGEFPDASVIEILHYPGSLQRDHILPERETPSRPSSRAESLISKLLHLQIRQQQQQGHHGAADSDSGSEYRSVSPSASEEFITPPQTGSAGLRSPASPARDGGRGERVGGGERDASRDRDKPSLFRNKSVDRKFLNEHGAQMGSKHHRGASGGSAMEHGGDDHDFGHLFKDLVVTRHKRSATQSGLVRPDLGELGVGPAGGGGAGAGGTGAAHMHNEGEKLYAVKEFRKRRRDETQKEYVKKLVAEFCISSNVHHENIVETVDLIQDENDHWCEVMEYVAGGDLYSQLQSGAIKDIEEINCLFKQLLHGVAYLHEVGVAHRDLKPENLLLDGGNRILKITDFGVSDVFRTCVEKTPRKAKGICGSEPYIAPEGWAGGEYEGPKVDMWACGVIYYIMLYKSIPWRSSRGGDVHYGDYLKRRRGVVFGGGGRSGEGTGSQPVSPALQPTTIATPVTPMTPLTLPSASISLSTPLLPQPPPQTEYHGYPPFDRQPPGPRRILYNLLDPNPATRWTAQQVLNDPWFKTVEFCRVKKDGAPAGVTLPLGGGGEVKYQVVSHKHHAPVLSAARRRMGSARSEDGGW
ncbi:serine/threonine-protein kinase HAL4/sat4 [Rhizophlyctis rosea]|nr:serine/threonine-protein kinase HAL4/sat4 [Rhizophlyctis rosea]